MIDIVFAGEDKKRFEKRAKQLGFEELLFVEKFGNKRPGELCADAVLISADNTGELRKQIGRAKTNYGIIIVLGSNDDVNRAAIEMKQIDILLSPEHSRRQDFMHHRDSGLNQVLCRLATENNVAMGIDFNEFSGIKDDKEKALRLGRIMQNIKLCSKYKTKILLASFSTCPEEMMPVSDLKSFALSIGMNTKQAKETLEIAGRLKK